MATPTDLLLPGTPGEAIVPAVDIPASSLSAIDGGGLVPALPALPALIGATLAGLEPGVSPAQAAVAIVVMAERLKAMVDAAGLAALAMLRAAVTAECADLSTGSMSPTVAAAWRDQMARDATVEEVKAATGLGEVECQRRLALVTADRVATVSLLSGMREGQVSLARALRVHEAVSNHDPVVADGIAAKVLAPCRDGSIPSQTLVAARLRRQLARHPVADPDGVRRDAIAARNAGGQLLADGSGQMTISGDGQRVSAAVCRVDALARAARASGLHGGRTLAQLRSDIALDLLLYGQPPGVVSAAVAGTGSAGDNAGRGAGELEPVGPPVGAYPPARVQLIVSLATLLGVNDGLGEIPGFGHVTAQQARDIAFAAGSTWHRLITDPVTGALLARDSRSYAPPPRLRAHVTTRDHACRGPGCQIPASSCDLDHDDPWPTGPTTAANLSAKHRRHHNLKTTGLWHAQHDPIDDTLTWTTLAQLTYTTYPHDYGDLDDPPLSGPPHGPVQRQLQSAAMEHAEGADPGITSPMDDLPPF